mmetsp:Transcript_24408/g.96840  ORF Transcript_24408/g.96840 Transcript_24408/m.96840 type:complete len:118 (+) Transcript_24408:357-710(+)
MKLICKELWSCVFGKHVDKLQTNHRGVFVLKDLNFRWLNRLSSGNEATQQQQMLQLLMFPVGMLYGQCRRRVLTIDTTRRRGALAQLGIDAIVSADHASFPSCTFNIRIRHAASAGS